MAFPQKEQLDYSALVKELDSKGPENLYLLYGPEEYLLNDFIRRLRKFRLGEGGGEFDDKVIAGTAPSLEELDDALGAMPFFGGGTFVHLNGLDINKCKDELFLSRLQDIPEYCTVVITTPAGQDPDGRLAAIKNLKKTGKVICFTAQSQGSLYNWIGRRVQAEGKTMGRDAMDRLMFISGNLMTRLIPEIEKICAYAPGTDITISDVEAVAHHIPEAITFEMTDAISKKDFDLAAGLLSELLAQNMSAFEILGGVSWQMRRLYGAKLGLSEGKGKAYVGELLGISSDYSLRLLCDSAERFTLTALRNCVRLCAEIDLRLKSAGAVEEDLMKELLVRFAMECKHA